jgi:hypothetical protein
VAASWATTPPIRVSDPVSVSGLPIALISNGSPSGVFSIERASSGPATTEPGTTRTSSTAIASAPALWSSLIRSSTPAPSIRPLTVIVTPGPSIGSRPAHARRRARSRPIWSTDVSPRACAPFSAASSFSSIAISVRSWSLRVLRLATRTVSSGAVIADSPGDDC